MNTIAVNLQEEYKKTEIAKILILLNEELINSTFTYLNSRRS